MPPPLSSDIELAKKVLLGWHTGTDDRPRLISTESREWGGLTWTVLRAEARIRTSWKSSERRTRELPLAVASGILLVGDRGSTVNRWTPPFITGIEPTGDIWEEQVIRRYCELGSSGSRGYAHASPLTEEIMLAVSGSVEGFKKKWTDHLNERFSNLFPDELPQGSGRWLEKTVDGKTYGSRPANVAWDKPYPNTELLRPVNPDDVLFLLQDVIDWGLGAELPRFVWSHHHDPFGESPPPHPVTLVSDPAPIIGPWEGSLGWGPNPFFPRPPRPPNEISFEGIDQINEVGSVVRKWIESPWVISVDVERLYDTSIEDLLILCVVGRPDDEMLDTWKFKLGILDDEDEWEVLHGLMEQASRWLAPGLAADDGEWVSIEFEFGGMASGAVHVAAKPITQGVYAISIDHGLEGQLPSVLGTATTDNLVEGIVGSIGSDPGIGDCWNGPSSAPFVTVGGNIPEEQLAAIEAAFKEEDPYDGKISMRPMPKPTSLTDRLKEYLGLGGNNE